MRNPPAMGSGTIFHRAKQPTWHARKHAGARQGARAVSVQRQSLESRRGRGVACTKTGSRARAVRFRSCTGRRQKSAARGPKTFMIERQVQRGATCGCDESKTDLSLWILQTGKPGYKNGRKEESHGMHPGPTAVPVTKPERAEKEPWRARQGGHWADGTSKSRTTRPGFTWRSLEDASFRKRASTAPHWTETMKKPSVRVVAESTRKTSPARAIAEDS